MGPSPSYREPISQLHSINAACPPHSIDASEFCEVDCQGEREIYYII